MNDTLFWYGLTLVRAEQNIFIRARLLAIYAIRNAPGDLFEELLGEAYASVELLPPNDRGPMMQEITIGLLAAGLL